MAEQAIHDDTHRNCHYRITFSGLYVRVSVGLSVTPRTQLKLKCAGFKFCQIQIAFDESRLNVVTEADE
jgi:hypothetical protein